MGRTDWDRGVVIGPPTTDMGNNEFGVRLDIGLDTALSREVDVQLIPDMSASQAAIREDELLEEKRAEFGWPGVAASVFVNGREIVRGKAGVRVVGHAAMIADDDKFHLGSCTKAMTATLLARYVDAGLVLFDTNLGSLFVDIDVNPAYQSVTLSQLIRHEGGTPGSLMRDMPDLWQYMWTNREGDQREVRQEIARRILSQPPLNVIGQYEYSNAAYIIVGAALESLVQESWENMMRLQVFNPLGMDECGFGMPAQSDEDPQPWGHRIGRDGPVAVAPGPSADNPTSLGPAGTIHCSLDSWMKFVQLHSDGFPENYLGAETLAALHAPTTRCFKLRRRLEYRETSLG